MALHQKVEKILDNLRLLMPMAAAFEDPLGGPQIVCQHDNLHRLLVVDADRLPIEGQTVANLYAEMARYQRAAEYAADIAEVRYIRWKSGKELEYRAQRAASPEPNETPPATEAEGEPKAKGKKAAPKAPPRPTVAETEAAYRDHPDYERMSLEPKRLRAIAGVFEDLKWAFKMKSEHIREAGKLLGGYLSTDRAPTPTAPGDEDPISSLEEMQADAERVVRASGSSEALAALLSANPPGATRTASLPE